MEIYTVPRRSGRVSRVVVNVFFAVALLAGIGVLLPSAFGLERHVVTGDSMDGSIGNGSVVYSEVVPVADLRVDDVITYLPPPGSGVDHLVTSRIVSIQGDHVRTKGDAVSETDPWVLTLSGPSQSRVTYEVPYLGYLFLALQDRAMRLLLVGLPSAALLLTALLHLRGPRRRGSDGGRLAPGGASRTPAPGSR